LQVIHNFARISAKMANIENDWHVLSGGARARIVDRDSNPVPVELVNCSSEQDFREAIELIDNEIAMGERGEFKEEKRRAFERMLVSGSFAAAGTMAACHWPVAAAPALVYYAELVRNFREYENLEKQENLAASISNLKKPEMSEEGERRGKELMEEARVKKFGK
jgi:hypothetical protein